MKMIEHKVINEDDFQVEGLIEELNKLAKDGWITTCSFGRKGKFLLLIREITSEDPKINE